jgi:3-isopropylmalate/(R)-2-methylmalate dehydratase small subunit
MIACEIPPDTLDELFREFAGSPAVLELDTEKNILRFTAGHREKTLPLALTDFERALIEAGGWVEYAAKRY